MWSVNVFTSYGIAVCYDYNLFRLNKPCFLRNEENVSLLHLLIQCKQENDSAWTLLILFILHQGEHCNHSCGYTQNINILSLSIIYCYHQSEPTSCKLKLANEISSILFFDLARPWHITVFLLRQSWRRLTRYLETSSSVSNPYVYANKSNVKWLYTNMKHYTLKLCWFKNRNCIKQDNVNKIQQSLAIPIISLSLCLYEMHKLIPFFLNLQANLLFLVPLLGSNQVPVLLNV
jgi:hypothetical protein